MSAKRGREGPPNNAGRGPQEHRTPHQRGATRLDEPNVCYRELVELIPAVVYVDASDELSSAVYMSPQAERLLGYTQEEWLADPELWVKLLHPDDRERTLRETANARETGEPFKAEYRLVSRDGRAVWFYDEAVPTPVREEGRPERWQGVLFDITERKMYEEGLCRSEQRHSLVARATGEAIWDNDLSTGKQEWAGATEALFGYPPHAGRTGTWWEEHIHPGDKERVLSGLDGLLAPGGGEEWSEEYRFRRADGSYAAVVDRGYVVRDADGKAVRMVGSMADVTESRRREQELKESEEMFRLAFEAAAVGMAHVAPDGRWLRFNRKFLEISGYEEEELSSLTYLDLTPPEDREASVARVRLALEGKIGPYSHERRFVRKDGSRVWVDLSVSLVRSLSGEPRFFVCAAEDVTSRKVKEILRELPTPREADVLRLVAAGRTNATIARDLNHSFGTVKLSVRRLLAKLGAKNREDLVRRAIEIGLIPPPR